MRALRVCLSYSTYSTSPPPLRKKRKYRNGGDRGRGKGVSEMVGERDKEMREQRAGSKEGMRETANDSEEIGRMKGEVHERDGTS